MSKIRYDPDTEQYEVCNALPGGQWEIYALPSLNDALRVAGIEPDVETPMAECGTSEDDVSDLWELLA